MDQYYYYAACIFIISVVSIGTTVLETKAVSFHFLMTNDRLLTPCRP